MRFVYRVELLEMYNWGEGGGGGMWIVGMGICMYVSRLYSMVGNWTSRRCRGLLTYMRSHVCGCT